MVAASYRFMCAGVIIKLLPSLSYTHVQHSSRVRSSGTLSSWCWMYEGWPLLCGCALC